MEQSSAYIYMRVKYCGTRYLTVNVKVCMVLESKFVRPNVQNKNYHFYRSRFCKYVPLRTNSR